MEYVVQNLMELIINSGIVIQGILQSIVKVSFFSILCYAVHSCIKQPNA